MSEKKPAPKLGDITPPTAEELTTNEEDAFEQRLVERLCRRYGIDRQLRLEMEWRNDELIGAKRLTFNTWHEMFPTFPVYLGAVIIPHLPKDCTVSKLFTSFGYRKFVKEYARLEQEIPHTATSLALGLVFRWPRLSKTGAAVDGLVMHNRSFNPKVPGVRLTWVSKDKSEFTVETFSTLLHGIDHDAPGRKGWRPD